MKERKNYSHFEKDSPNIPRAAHDCWTYNFHGSQTGTKFGMVKILNYPNFRASL